MNPASTRDQDIQRVLGIVLLFNWLVAGAKIAVGIAAGRITILADGLHGLLDGANNVLGIVALRAAAQPPDREHPYGHRKFENIAAMAIGGLIVLIAWEITDNLLRTIWRALKHGPPVSKSDPVDPLFVGILAGSLVINLLVARYEKTRGTQLQSSFLKADAGHTLSDCAVTGLSLASLFLGGWAWWVDPLLAVGVLVFLVRAAWEIIRENLPAFTDHALLDPEDIERVVGAVDGVLGVSAIRSHGTVHDIHIDLTIEVDRDITAGAAEEIEHAVRQRLTESHPGASLIGIHHRVSENTGRRETR